jgi:DnaJ-class molecular chaperone
VNVPVTLEEVLCGFNKVVSLYDDDLHIHQPHYTNPTVPTVIPNQGLPDFKDRHNPHEKRKGNLVVHYDVVFPSDDRCCKYQEILCRLFKRPFPVNAPGNSAKSEDDMVVL